MASRRASVRRSRSSGAASMPVGRGCGEVGGVGLEDLGAPARAGGRRRRGAPRPSRRSSAVARSARRRLGAPAELRDRRRRRVRGCSRGESRRARVVLPPGDSRRRSRRKREGPRPRRRGLTRRRRPRASSRLSSAVWSPIAEALPPSADDESCDTCTAVRRVCPTSLPIARQVGPEPRSRAMGYSERARLPRTGLMAEGVQTRAGMPRSWRSDRCDARAGRRGRRGG